MLYLSNITLARVLLYNKLLGLKVITAVAIFNIIILSVILILCNNSVNR